MELCFAPHDRTIMCILQSAVFTTNAKRSTTMTTPKVSPIIRHISETVKDERQVRPIGSRMQAFHWSRVSTLVTVNYLERRNAVILVQRIQ